jgi:Fic family protein
MALFKEEKIFTPGGQLDQWIGSYPDEEGIKAIRQSTTVIDKKDTLKGLEILNDKYPNQPSILIRLAEVYYLLHYTTGAQDIADTIINILDVKDEIFMTWAKKVIEWTNKELKHNINLFDRLMKEGAVFSGWVKRITEYKCREPVDTIDEIRRTWTNMLNNLTQSQITLAYARMLSIETNQLEDVFLLDKSGDTLTKLVKGGYYLGAIQHTDANSKITDFRTILSIISEVQRALNIIRTRQNFTSDFIKEIHWAIMYSSRLTTHLDENTMFRYPYLIPSGVWRKKTVFIKHPNKTLVFHPFNEISKSMNIFTEFANDIFRENNVGAYTFAAWIHHTLINIHPFEDGNGRVTRLISSVPLFLAGLPPICISLENKNDYYQALDIADRESNIAPLAQIFAKEALNTLHNINQLGASINIGESQMDIETASSPYF